jgi:hypothetical protein
MTRSETTTRTTMSATFQPFSRTPRLRVILAGISLGAMAFGAGHATAAGAVTGTPAAPPADHVIFISVDGFRPEFYLDERWPAPMLQRMARAGAHARAVRGVTPTVTYPSHTTLVTGALPARHGIFHNRPFEAGGASGRWYMESEQIRVPALWDAVRSAGRTSAAISWPVSAGAAIDWNIPEYWSVAGREGDLTGAAAHAAALRARVTPAGLLEEIARAALGEFPAYYWGRNLSREDAVGAMASHLIEKYRPNLLLVHLNQTDYYQHAHGRDHPDVKLAVAAIDRAITRMVEAAERAGILERTAFVIGGDHGFVDVETRVAPNVWLVEAGLHEDRPDRGEWRAAFHPGGGSAFLYLRDERDQAAVREVRRALERLPETTRALFRIVERDEVIAAGGDPRSALALAAVPGVTLVGETNGPAVAPGNGGTHGYLPEFQEIHTGFIAWGAGVARGQVLPRIGLEDVAPVVAALLELEFRAPDGTLPPGIVAHTDQPR